MNYLWSKMFASSHTTDRDRANSTCELRVPSLPAQGTLQKATLPRGSRERKPRSIETLKNDIEPEGDSHDSMAKSERGRYDEEAVSKQGVLFTAQRIMVTR